MAQYTKHFVQDLKQDIKIRQCGTIVFNDDSDSNILTIDVFNGEEPAALSGTVLGAVICSDGTTVPVFNGSFRENTVTITLTAACFAVVGQIGVGVQVIDGSKKTTILKAIFNVEPFSTSVIVDPDERITNTISELVQEIETAIASIPADYSDLMATIAPGFNTSTSYTAGQCVWYDSVLYMFTSDHPAGAWIGTDAEIVTDIIDNLVLVQSTEPTAIANKLWVPTVGMEEVRVLTEDDIATVAETQTYLGW